MMINEFPDSIILYSTQSRKVTDAGYNANCHGYTITGGHTTLANWKELITFSDMSDKNILVYTHDNNISHSGRIIGNSFIHYISRIGIVLTPLDIAIPLRTEYKDGVFVLPFERVQLSLHLANAKFTKNKKRSCPDFTAIFVTSVLQIIP